MEKIIMLGTGMGFSFNCYNTCFVIQNDNKNFLIDTGGGAQIVQNLAKCNIPLSEIHDIFISHCHTDHILGLFWILKRITFKYEGQLNIYCNDEVANAIKNIYPFLFPNIYVKEIDRYLNIKILSDGENVKINNKNYTFFDCEAKGNKLYGFDTLINNKRLVFIGDETCNPDLYNKIKNSDYLMHEAFCLYSEEKIFKAYEKHHSTVKDVCQSLNKLNIKNLILFHTEDTHLENRKELYTAEAKKYFDGNVYVPDDLEEIIL